MGIVFAIAIYFIIWWVTLFTVLPFGVRTQGEAGEVVPGTPASAPANMNLTRVLAINTVLATVVFSVVWLLMETGVVSTDMFWVKNNAPV